MGAIVVQTYSVLRLHGLSYLTYNYKHKFTKSIFSPRDVPCSVERKDIRLTVSSIGSDGNRRDRPLQRSSTPSRRNPSNDEEDERSLDDQKPNTSSEEDILAIFRRIQSSLSKDEQQQGRTRNEGVNRKTSTRTRSVTKRGQGRQDYAQQVVTTEWKLTRPLSKFVKRTPIPSQTTSRGIALEPKNGMSPNADGVEELDRSRVEEMKVAELKELAKSRGLKGYSKLKKSELIKLLKS